MRGSHMNQNPVLTFENKSKGALLERAFGNALKNLMEINTLPCDMQRYNSTGLLLDPPGSFIRAGGEYQTPWTRDASINSWNAASLLEPKAAQNTLWAVCQRDEDGKLIIQQDDQWWDQIIWVTGAWNHYCVTGDKAFLTQTYEAAANSLKLLTEGHYNTAYQLYEGPAVMSDGIAGYPKRMYDPQSGSSFVLAHRGCEKMMVLSTNCIYYNAMNRMADMAALLNEPDSTINAYRQKAARLGESINRHFWMEKLGNYGYLIVGAGESAGELDTSQEAMGLAYAILFGIASPEQQKRIFQSVTISPKGITLLWPHFEGFSDEHPSRHNVLIWPIVSGMWTHAAAFGKQSDFFAQETESLAALSTASGDNFYEIYDPITGQIEGGWQLMRGQDHHWDSCTNQTWSATAYLRMLFKGLFGMEFTPDGIIFNPLLPIGWGSIALSGLRYRESELTLRLEGSGGQIQSFTLDGQPKEQAFFSADLTGTHEIKIIME